jgi:hypothetical protein
VSFVPFLLVNAMLFNRPAEFHPALYGLPIYEVCILSCLAVSYPQVAAELTPAALAARPLNACVAGMLPAIVLSHMANGKPTSAFNDGVEFLRLLLYYFLLVAAVDTPKRLERFLAAQAAFAVAIHRAGGLAVSPRRPGPRVGRLCRWGWWCCWCSPVGRRAST